MIESPLTTLKAKPGSGRCICGDPECLLIGCKTENLARAIVAAMLKMSSRHISPPEQRRGIEAGWPMMAPIASQAVNLFRQHFKFRTPND